MIPRSRPDALALVVFDWDGTLMDSIARIVGCLQQAITHLGAEPRTDLQLRDIIGLGIREATQRLYPGADEAFEAAFTQAYRLYYLDRDRTPAPLFAGAPALLSTLTERGYLLAVATGKSRRGLDEALRDSGLTGHFAATATSDEHPSKPDPAMLRHLIDRLGVDSCDAVMVGDSVHDLQMARNLHVTGIGITHGVHDAVRLRDHAPSAVIGGLEELLDLLPPRRVAG